MNNPETNKKRSSLRIRMIFYFLLIAIANVFVLGEIVYEISSKSYKEEVFERIDKDKQSERVNEMDLILNKIVKKFVFMVIILIVVSATVLFLFVVQIVTPLQYMINIADKMSDGDLSLRVDIKSKDELADLGNLINDLSGNVQEIIAQIERLNYDLQKIEKVHSKTIQKHPKLPVLFRKETDMLQKLSQDMAALKDSYVLYTIESYKNLYLHDKKE